MTVLPRPPNDGQPSTPPATEHPDSEPEPDILSDDDDDEPASVDPQILLRDTEPKQRASTRSNKGIYSSTKFADETTPRNFLPPKLQKLSTLTSTMNQQ